MLDFTDAMQIARKLQKNDFFLAFQVQSKKRKRSLSFFRLILMSYGRDMLDFADVGSLPGNCTDESIFCFGLDTWAEGSLSFKFD